jgi:hypothetical protein
MRTFKKIDENIWADTSESQSGIISANKIKPPGINILIFSFIEKNNLPRIIFENVSSEFIKTPKLKSIGLENVPYTIENEGERIYLEITCNIEGFKRYYIDFTNKLINYLLDGLSLSDSYYKAFDEWKAFLHINGSKLTLEEQYGLIAELHVLCDLIENINPMTAMKTWRGPYKEIDFKFTTIEIEVKATLKKKHEHLINGIDQLLKMKDQLGVISFCLIQTENGGFSLPDYVLKVEDLLINFPSLIIQFRNLIHEFLKYDLSDEDSYNANRFDIKEIKYFDINDGFPVFTSENLKAPLPDNISNLKYTLDFTNLISDDYNNLTLKNKLDGV